MKRQPVQLWQPGDVFVVENLDGSFSVGQVVSGNGPETPLVSIRIALSAIRSANAAEAIEEFSADPRIISITFALDHALDDGKWKVIGSCEIQGWMRDRDIGGAVRNVPGVHGFLNAFHCLKPWDAYADPNYLDTWLLEESLKPRKPLLKNEL